jgi:hypothetical protein
MWRSPTATTLRYRFGTGRVDDRGNTRKEEQMHKLRRLLLALAAVSALSAIAVVPALGVTDRPVINDLIHFADPPGPLDTWCGSVEGRYSDAGVEHYMQDASGNFIDTLRVTSVFTAESTGKSLESNGTGTARSVGPIDNGDGTISLVTHFTGLTLQFRIPNGPVLKDANGKPILGAGELTTTDVFDAATGDYITTTESWHGPHPVRDGVDICGPSIAYLLDP